MKNQFADSPYNVDGIVESGIASQKNGSGFGYPPQKYAKNMVGQITKKSSKFNLYGGSIPIFAYSWSLLSILVG